MLANFFSRIPPDGADQYILFSFSHIISALLSLVVLGLLIFYAAKLKGKSYEKYVRYFYVFVMFSTNITIWKYAYDYNLPWTEYLPLATCGWGVILGSIGLALNNKFLLKVTAFYGWGAIMSVVVPNILEGPMHYYMYNYLYRHILIVLIPFYAKRAMGMEFVKKDFWHYFFVTSGMFFIAYFISIASPNPNEVNMFYTIEPAIGGTPLTWIYNFGHIYYFVFWYLVASFFGYLWGYLFYKKGSTLL